MTTHLLSINPLPEIILYGGTFDPPHLGHRDCVVAVHKYFKGAKILLVPAQVPASTRPENKTPQASFEHRVNMLHMAFSDLPYTEICSIERQLEVPNYTVKTLEAIQKIYPNQRMAIIMGQDQFNEFEHWHQADIILQKADLIVVERKNLNGSTTNIPLIEKAHQLAKIFGLQLRERLAACGDLIFAAQLYHENLSAYCYAINAHASAAESRIIRHALAQGDQLPDGWIDDKVLDYIKNQGLYGTKQQDKT